MRGNKYYKITVLIVLLMGLITSTYAQLNAFKELEVNFTIPPVALLDIEPGVNNTIYFTVVPASESGASPRIENTSNQTLWLNYSSATERVGASRAVVAQISGGSLPEGVVLSVKASAYTGNGDGDLGRSTNKVQLSNQPRAILTNIGNCYTGDGTGNGHSLTFTIDVSDYSQISSADDAAFTILYTIRDN